MTDQIPPCPVCAYRHEPTTTDRASIVQGPDTYNGVGRLRAFSPSYTVHVDGHRFNQPSRSDARRIAKKYAAGRPVQEYLR